MMFECLADINSEPIIPPTSNLPITNLLLPISIIGCLADINNEPIISPTSNANNKIKKSRRNKWKNNIARTSYKSLQGKGMKKFKKVDDNDETEVMFNIKEEDREMMMFEWLADINRKGMKKSKKVDDNDETEVMFNIKEEDRDSSNDDNDKGKGMKKFKEADDNDETEVMFNIKEDQADINSESIISSTSNANNKTKKSPQNKQRNNIARTSYNSSQGIDKVEIIFEYKEDDLAECIKNNKKRRDRWWFIKI
ncbi:13623_t:CDS:2 [Entrophospora sp. SA101]|nr:13623_t:CDS:2 [Entrophospora sp. SA101]